MPLPPDRARGCQAPPPSPRQKLAEAMFSFTRLISDLPVPPSNARVHTPLGLSSSLLFPWLFEKVTSETKQSSPASRHGPSAEDVSGRRWRRRRGWLAPATRSPNPFTWSGVLPSGRRLLPPPLITSSPSSWGREWSKQQTKRRLNSTLFLSAASPQPPGKPFSEIKESPSATFSLAGLFQKKLVDLGDAGIYCADNSFFIVQKTRSIQSFLLLPSLGLIKKANSKKE